MGLRFNQKHPGYWDETPNGGVIWGALPKNDELRGEAPAQNIFLKKCRESWSKNISCSKFDTFFFNTFQNILRKKNQVKKIQFFLQNYFFVYSPKIDFIVLINWIQ